MLIAREHFSFAFPLETQIENGTRGDSDCDLRVDADVGQRPSIRFEDQRQVDRVGFGEVNPGYQGRSFAHVLRNSALFVASNSRTVFLSSSSGPAPQLIGSQHLANFVPSSASSPESLCARVANAGLTRRIEGRVETPAASADCWPLHGPS